MEKDYKKELIKLVEKTEINKADGIEKPGEST